ncbi:Protein FAM63A [Termitomyces sp. J132]|nr:Protein FAM63A [Termitomyces sp. J132]
MADTQAPTIQSSRADVWYLKKIVFKGNPLQIITQNFNGPCSFIAICNILIMRGNIIIEPPARTTVSYEFLSQLVAEYLLKHSPNVDISDALSIMPHTQKGLDLNPLFTSSTSFQPANKTAGGELLLFSQVGIDLVHGWLVDPDSPEARAMREENAEDYDSAVSLIAEADHITGGLLVPIDGDIVSAPKRRDKDWSDAEHRKISNALIIRQFLENTQSQMTYHGLFHLASTLEPGALVALFRSSHLSVLHKSGDSWQVLDDTNTQVPPATTDDLSGVVEPSSPILSAVPPPVVTEPSEPALYSLVSDHVFLYEPSVVWERIEDVDGSAGIFVDSSFVRASPPGGDWAGRTAEDMARDIQRAQEEADRVAEGAETGLSDAELARQLQAEEDRYARREQEVRLQQQQQKMEEEKRQKELQVRAEKERQKQNAKKKKDCIIM